MNTAWQVAKVVEVTTQLSVFALCSMVELFPQAGKQYQMRQQHQEQHRQTGPSTAGKHVANACATVSNGDERYSLAGDQIRKH